MITLRTKLEIFAALIAAGLIWYFAIPKPAPVNTWAQAKVAPEVAAVPTQTLQCKPVIVYVQAAKQKLNLPPDVKANPNQFVIGSTKVGSSLRPLTMTTVFDDHSGQSTILVKRDPYPWLAAEQTGELRLSYGFRGMQKMARMTASEDLLQIKGINLGVVGSVDMDGQTFVGAGIAYRW